MQGKLVDMSLQFKKTEETIRIYEETHDKTDNNFNQHITELLHIFSKEDK